MVATIGKHRARMAELLRVDLRTIRAYLLREDFHSFWGYVAPYWAANFLDRWTTAAFRFALGTFRQTCSLANAGRITRAIAPANASGCWMRSGRASFAPD
jgi:hypothetical protein